MYILYYYILYYILYYYINAKLPVYMSFYFRKIREGVCVTRQGGADQWHGVVALWLNKELFFSPLLYSEG